MTDSPINDEAANAAARVFYGRAYGSVGDEANKVLLDGAREALEAAYPAIRQQVAEEIATKAEDAADDLDLPVMPEWLDQRAWFKDQLHNLAAAAREIGTREAVSKRCSHCGFHRPTKGGLSHHPKCPHAAREIGTKG